MDFGPRHRGSVQRATALRGVRLRSVSCHRAYLQRLFTTSFRSDINYLWGFFSTHTIFWLIRGLQGLRFSSVWHCFYEATTREVPAETSLSF